MYNMFCFPKSFHEYVTQLVMKSNDCFNKASTTYNIVDCTHKWCFAFPVIHFLLVTAKSIFWHISFYYLYFLLCEFAFVFFTIYWFMGSFIHSTNIFMKMRLGSTLPLREWCPHWPSVCAPGCDIVSRQRQ